MPAPRSNTNNITCDCIYEKSSRKCLDPGSDMNHQQNLVQMSSFQKKKKKKKIHLVQQEKFG